MQLVSGAVTGGGLIRMPRLSAVFRLLSLARGVFALIGLAAVLVVTVPAVRDVMMQQADALVRANQSFADSDGQTAADDGAQSVADDASQTAAASPSAGDDGTPADMTIQVSVKSAETRREEGAVAAFIARRYRVADEAASDYVAAAYRAGRQLAVDPLLVLAVMAVESRYNPVAESHVGAKGLMQVLPRFHLDKLAAHGGEQALLDPDVNIEVGTQILREYLHRFGVTVTALQQYAGAMDEPTTQYANKVLAERSRLQRVLNRMRGKS
jgi:soluble lytic murein transglycosylase-like protein